INKEIIHKVEAVADARLQAEASANLEVLGVAAFAVEVKKTGDPVEVGQTLTYEITVTNTGSQVAEKVLLTAQSPPELEAAEALGPLGDKGTIEAPQIAFNPVERLQPTQSLTYRVTARGRKPGDVRFRVEVSAQTLQPPILKVVSTTVYD